MYRDMDQWMEIRRRVLVEGVSKRHILRETGMHWTTLEKILTHSQPPGYRRGKPIVTTNLPFENWTEVLGSERLTGALLDRLTHRMHILEANGESYRLAESRRRLKRRKKPA